MYNNSLTSKNGCLFTKTNFFFYKFSLPSVLFKFSCIQRYYTNARGQGRMVLIRTKKKPAPTRNAGERIMPLSWYIDAVVSSSSLSPFPRPCRHLRICYFFPSSPAFLLPVFTQRTVPRDGGWGSGGGGGGGGDASSSSSPSPSHRGCRTVGGAGSSPVVLLLFSSSLSTL